MFSWEGRVTTHSRGITQLGNSPASCWRILTLVLVSSLILGGGRPPRILFSWGNGKKSSLVKVGSLRNLRPSKGFQMPLQRAARTSVMRTLSFIPSPRTPSHTRGVDFMPAPHVGVRDRKEGHSLRDSVQGKDGQENE